MRPFQPAKAIDQITDLKVIRRFVDKLGQIGDECWQWYAGHDKNGYGQFWYNGRSHWAHRISYAIFNGGIPDGLTIDHKCFNTLCVNPKHVQLMTHPENCGRHKETESCTSCTQETLTVPSPN
jgi:hypothetical protein